MKKEENKFILWLKQKLGSQNGELHDNNSLNKNDLLSFASTLKVPEGQGEESVWENLSKRIEDKKPQRITIKNKSRILIYSIAASLIVLLGLTIFLTSHETIIICERGSKLNYLLPDSSEILLNADSKISYNKFTYNWNREIKLEGEAFFKVKKGNSFKIYAQNTLTTVLGTSFNIYARGKDVEISCKTGKVSVEIPGSGNKEILTQGYKVIARIDSLSERVSTDAKSIANWENGKFKYKRTQLSVVLEELERQFAIKINCDNCKGRYYTGHFYNKNLEEALKMITIPLELNYKIKGNTVQLY